MNRKPLQHRLARRTTPDHTTPAHTTPAHRNLARAASSAVAASLLITALAGCGGSSSAGTSASGGSTGSAASSGTAYPVTIDVCGEKVTFDKAPTRAVSNDINPFEDMVALGLESSMVGTFGLSGFGPDGESAVPTKYAAAYAKVKAVSPQYFEVEPLVGLKPDFLFAGWNYGLKVGTTKTPDQLATYGIKTYALRESCAHVQPSKQAVTIDDTYTDLSNLGKIFNVSAKADAVIAGMKARIAAVQAKVADQPKKTVFLYDGGTDSPFTAPGLAMPDALIQLAGGRNIFHDLKQTWTTVSWEQVVKADPDCIVVNDYGTPTYDQKVAFLKSNATTKSLRAVTSGCFIHSSYGELTPSPDNADAVETIAKGLYPSVF